MSQKYLSNKIKDEKYLNVKFPDKPVTQDVIDFLESQGFLDISRSYNKILHIVEAIEKSGNGNLPLYVNTYNGMKSMKSYRTIYIFGGGEVTNDNPVFAMLTKDDGDINNSKYLAGNIFNSKHSLNGVSTFSELRERIVNHFNWI